MKIGVDLDNVLADHMSALVKYYNHRYATALTRDSFRSLKFWETWGGTREEAIETVHEFYASLEFAAILPVEGAEEGVDLLTHNNRLEIITARPSDLLSATSDWLNAYFPDKFAGAYFGNHYAKNGLHATSKLALCQFLGVDVLVEDSLEHALECADQRRRVVLLDNPWNQSSQLPENVYRVDSWKEAVATIERFY